jgi:malto-oligosyltrehalose trehalohydrolase
MNDPTSFPVWQLNHLLGAISLPDERVRFCVWSPTSRQVSVHVLDGRDPIIMERTPGGYHCIVVAGVPVGARYLYQFDDGTPRPDPTSRYQPDGVHGPSEVVGRSFAWNDSAWSGVDRDSLVIYEMHIGAFTEAGTFRSAVDRLDELVELGVTAIELMPLADCAGRWNWGYDGVCLFAPNRNYGTPNDLRRLVDAAHTRGLAVVLDVVYNHLGPEGNYLGESGPYLSNHHSTVWGAAPNFDDATHAHELRRFFIANAIYWFDEYHIDGIRVDAIHCMKDESEIHVVREMAEACQAWSRESNRSPLLIAESNVYDPEMLAPIEKGGIGFDAEWCDDFLHSVFAVVRPDEHLCHRQYEPATDLDQTLRVGYVFEGTLRDERGRCAPTERVDTAGLIYSIQHHDFIGNHPLGKRLHQLTSRNTQRAAAALLLMSPAIPMLFMGEEFACERPFQFFVDFSDQPLRNAVIEGRKREYPQHDWSGGVLPTDRDAFELSKIGKAEEGDDSMRRWYRSLIRLRRQLVVDGLLDNVNYSCRNAKRSGLFSLSYQTSDCCVLVAVRLSELPCDESQIDLRSSEIEIPDSLSLRLDSRSGESSATSLLPNHAKIFSNRKIPAFENPEVVDSSLP